MRHRALGWIRAAAGCAVALALAAPAAAEGESCREWRAEHAQWKARAIRLYLNGAAQAELDSALFEMLQREVYLTSCALSADLGRAELVGWRLVDRAPDEYGAAVLESVLEQGGFALDLAHHFESLPDPASRRAAASLAAPGPDPRRAAR